MAIARSRFRQLLVLDFVDRVADELNKELDLDSPYYELYGTDDKAIGDALRRLVKKLESAWARRGGGEPREERP